MPSFTLFIHLPFLLFLLNFFTLTDGCPADCSCQPSGSIFCFSRRSSSMPRGLPASTKNLYVFQNGIDTLVQEDFGGLGDLEMLDISQNELTEVPDGVFSVLSSLHNLDLSSNHITHISKDSFAGLVMLERLYLHSNKIQSIHPAAFEGLDHLLELKLQGNQLTVLPTLHLPRLLLLDLSQNRISLPAPGDLQTPHLESLKIAGLALTSLDEELMASLGNLHDLDVSQNQLVGMPPALKAAKGLIRLNLSANPLGPLKLEDFQNLVNLQELDLSSLNLQGFPEGFFQLFPKLSHLTAAENPYNCLCPLAWFPTWLRDKGVDLARTEETRCHFPPINAGRMLAELERQDFGCPTTTTVLTSAGSGSSTPEPPVPTTVPGMTHAIPPPPPPPSEEPSSKTDSYPPPQAPASPSSTSGDYGMCPPNICLNGGTCRFDQHGHVRCLCPPSTSGLYCEIQEETEPPPSSPHSPVETVATAEPDSISSRQVTSTSILLDLHRYFESRPHIRAIRLTYRNLSGPDRRPLQLNVPASYPEYTLRGLQPNCTYSVCASPLGEPVGDDGGSCMEARTAGISPPSSEPQIEEGQLSSTLIPVLVAVALVMVIAVVTAIVILLRKKRTKTDVDLDVAEAPPMEMEGVKTCLENTSMLQKQPEITPCPPPTQNGTDYQVPLMHGQCSANNNVASLKPSYF
ncbi:vasorin a [Chanos chanos]|uniref:Vasorin a n=1 Tax=Chanos chanos TaxID=29144 RepID=A0A6J2W4J7_CHACN|nr:vasorin-like [Chanos chanos]